LLVSPRRLRKAPTPVRFAIEGKRLSTAIMLVTLALSAFFSARGTTSLIAGAVLPPEPVTTATSRSTKLDRPPGSDLPDAHAILARNIFDPTTGSLWPPKVPEAPEPEPGAEPAQEQTLAPGEIPPPCDGAVRLVASIYSENHPDWSFASMTAGSDAPLLYRAGGTVGDKQVVSIFPKAVFMRSTNGRLCSLVLFTDKEAAAAAAAANASRVQLGDAQTTESVTPPPSPGSLLGGSAFTEADMDANIKAQSETKFSVQRSFVDKVLQNQAEIMRSARIVPHEENGQVVGVKLYGIRRNSLLGKLGLQNGDLLRTINGFAMSSPDTALEAYSKLRSANNLSVAVVRRGRPLSVDYDIQ